MPNKKFIDVCSGLGGFRLALEANGHKCVGFSEIDKHAIKVYKENFDCSNDFEIGDITKFQGTLPAHDILCAGFPCQPFSTAGKRKGLDDERGSIFEYILNIASRHKTQTLLLENVKGLISINGGSVFKSMINSLEEEGYVVSYRVICGTEVSVQKRNRLYIIADRSNIYDLDRLQFRKRHRKVSDILDSTCSRNELMISEKAYSGLIRHKEKHRAANNGFGFSLCFPVDETTRTISHRYYKDGSECLISDSMCKLPRKLALSEMKKLFTFPDSYKLNVSRTRGYMLLGNSVIIDILKSICTLF